jgi:hypothetical protein
MAEQTFKSPGFFEREIDLTGLSEQTIGIPAGIIGTAPKGPAFVPIDVGSLNSLIQKFGDYNNENFGMIAAKQYIESIPAVTYVRVLGAGANKTSGDIANTRDYGTVKNAGFRLVGKLVQPQELRDAGAVQFLCAHHEIQPDEKSGYPIFTQNNSFGGTTANIIRSMILLASGARMEVMDHDEIYPITAPSSNGHLSTLDDTAQISQYDSSPSEGTFKIVISSSIGKTFANDDSRPGIKIYTASLNPQSKFYVGDLLNTSPSRFHEKQHLLYADFPVNHYLAKVKYDASVATIAIASGTNGTSLNGNSSLAFTEAFGSFNTRYQAAQTTKFISQPFGKKEYDLFHFEAIDDGVAGNQNVKISIANLKKSTNPNNPYGTFTVQVRRYEDTDVGLQVLEQFSQCSLNPDDPNFVLAKIGDKKIFYDFDSEIAIERGLKSSGGYANKSKYVRIICTDVVKNREVPPETLPFGFRGLPLIKTTNDLKDVNPGDTITSGHYSGTRLNLKPHATETVSDASDLNYSILPPVPFSFKATRGKTHGPHSNFTGFPHITEQADSRVYWGIKTTDLLRSSSNTGDVVLRSNAGGIVNDTVNSYSKLLGIAKLDVLVTGSSADLFSNNKFTLARVGLNNQSNATATLEKALATEMTGTVSDHMKEAAYIRWKDPKGTNLLINDTTGYNRRLTFGSLAVFSGSTVFNKFSDYMKFTNILYGGFDGVNILDKDQQKQNDRASSTEVGGKAQNGTDFIYQNLRVESSPGTRLENNTISSYRAGINILTNEYTSRINILAVPGIKEPLVTDYAADKTRDYGKAIYLMDIPAYDKNKQRVYLDSTNNINVEKTLNKFNERPLDNSFVATYFPDVIMNDEILNQNITVPSSIAAIKALGINDANKHPWFAPAGFNRGSLDNVANVKTRLNTQDKDNLYESNINPIASFPTGNRSSFVIFGQKTLQKEQSSLDRVNVRRMLLEIKRIISDSARKLLFKKNNQKVRNRFIADVTPKLATIQSKQGIEKFKVIMDSSNNSDRDVSLNRLNGKIILVPTRAIEFVAIDFIITNSGVSFE